VLALRGEAKNRDRASYVYATALASTLAAHLVWKYSGKGSGLDRNT